MFRIGLWSQAQKRSGCWNAAASFMYAVGPARSARGSGWRFSRFLSARKACSRLRPKHSSSGQGEGVLRLDVFD